VGVCALNTKLAGVFVLVACVLAGCGQGSSGASTATGLSTPTSTSPPPPSPPPSTSGNATLSWQAPTTDTNGAPLTDLAGYRIYYGTSATDLSDTIQLTSVGLQTYVIQNLASGTWYFAVTAVASTGVESALSDVVSKTI
jgi:fibronectin type III domain protein